jgi:hypothetical protein
MIFAAEISIYRIGKATGLFPNRYVLPQKLRNAPYCAASAKKGYFEMDKQKSREKLLQPYF